MGLPATASHFDPSHSPEEVQRVWFKSSRKLEKPDGPMRARAPVEAAVFAIPEDNFEFRDLSSLR